MYQPCDYHDLCQLIIRCEYLYYMAHVLGPMRIISYYLWTFSFVYQFNSPRSIQHCILLALVTLSHTFIVVSVLSGTHLHLSEVKHMSVKCFAYGRLLSYCTHTHPLGDVDVPFRVYELGPTFQPTSLNFSPVFFAKYLFVMALLPI